MKVMRGLPETANPMPLSPCGRGEGERGKIISRFLICAGLSPSVPGTEPAAIEQLSWLSGCWERTHGDRHIQEQWMAPAGGVMLGMSRTVEAGALREYEYMRIEEQGGGLVFIARPSGQEGASFPSISVTASKVVFENPAHDFPQRVIYARGEDGSLQARIEGAMDGKAQGVDFTLQRAACPAGG